MSHNSDDFENWIALDESSQFFLLPSLFHRQSFKQTIVLLFAGFDDLHRHFCFLSRQITHHDGKFSHQKTPIQFQLRVLRFVSRGCVNVGILFLLVFVLVLTLKLGSPPDLEPEGTGLAFCLVLTNVCWLGVDRLLLRPNPINSVYAYNRGMQ